MGQADMNQVLRASGVTHVAGDDPLLDWALTTLRTDLRAPTRRVTSTPRDPVRVG